MNLQELAIPYQDILPIALSYREQLRTSIRFERFCGNESIAEWRYLLGDDVNAAAHPGVTFNIAREFLALQDSLNNPRYHTSIADKEKILATALIHDWGEIVLDGDSLGDVSFDQKNSVHEKKEMVVFQRVVSGLPDEKRDYLLFLYQDIAKNPHTPLGKIFNAIERIGYLKTALRAYHGVDGKKIENWQGLTGNVLSNQMRPLVDYTTKFPYVKIFLSIHEVAITTAFAELQNKPIPKDRDGRPSYDMEKLEAGYSAWEKYWGEE